MNEEEIIGKKFFTLEDQYKFARFTGDFNPIHINTIYSRRTMMGECVVHGMNGLLFALECLLNAGGGLFSKFRVRFIQPILLNEIIYIQRIRKKNLNLIDEFGNVRCTVEFSSETAANSLHNFPIKLGDKLTKPNNLNLISIKNFHSAEWLFCGSESAGRILFPKLFMELGSALVTQLAATSEVIGMRIPGLNSIYLGIEVTILTSNHNPRYTLKEFDQRFGILNLFFDSPVLNARVTAAYRRSHDIDLRMDYISEYVKPLEFCNVSALIIGGSRGVGEMLAKIIACGGGRAIVTFNDGEDDAKKIQHDIRNFGVGACEILKLSILDDFILPNFYFNEVYYCASPKIKKEIKGHLNLSLVKKYHDFYVKGFSKVLEQILKINRQCSVFYPSTIYLESKSSDYLAYIEAKAEGERVCQNFNGRGQIKTYYFRLPRLPTDQTLGVLPEVLKNPINILYSIVVKMGM